MNSTVWNGEYLETFGFEVKSASSGRTALHEMMIEYIGQVSKGNIQFIQA